LDKNTTKPLFSKKFKEKRAARVLAVQALYAHHNHEGSRLDQTIFDIIKDSKSQEVLSKLSKSDEKLIINLARGTQDNLELVTAAITKHLSKEWRFERLGKVMQAILLIAAYEMMMDSEVDRAILINEYIEITKMFNHEGEAGFVNSVLDGISKDSI
jgi:N utilization substance protein B